MVALESIIVRSEAVLDVSVDDETVLMSVATGQYLTLKDTSQAIWIRIAQPICVGDLCRDLAQLYRAPLEQVQIDTLAFLNHLAAHDIVAQRTA
jgi:hypothetical protein